jgi:Type IV secretion system pilin
MKKFIHQFKEHHTDRMRHIRKRASSRSSTGIAVVAIMLACCFGMWTSASAASRGDYGTQPSEVLDRVVGDANKVVKIQDTALDRVTESQGQFASKYKVANTLDSVRQNIAPYLQWFIFIGLAVATILIIITGFQLVTSQSSGEDTKKAQGRIKNIVIGIVIMTGFYLIVKIFMSLLSYILQ